MPGQHFKFTRAGGQDGTWHFEAPGVLLHDLPAPGLAGEAQFANAAAALAAIGALGWSRELTRERVAPALSRVRLPGRFQIVPGEVQWIFDVAHNEQAAQGLAENLALLPRSGRCIAVVGILRDKDVEAISAALADAFDEWLACTLPGERGLQARELQARLDPRCKNVRLAASVEQGCELARASARAGDRVVVFGSFHTVGPALEALGLY